MNILWIIQLASLGIMLAAMLGHKFAWLPFTLAFGVFALALLLVVLFTLWHVGLLVFGLLSSGGGSASYFILATGAVPLAFLFIMVGSGVKAPAIHDIATRLDPPILFEQAQQLRKKGENSLQKSAQEVADLQQQFYPHIQAHKTPLSPEEAYRAAMSVAQQLGWQVHYTNESARRFEAVDETAMFGFKDDIAVQVDENAEGTYINVRSVSRVGKSDLGANAKRIERFMKSFSALEALPQAPLPE